MTPCIESDDIFSFNLISLWIRSIRKGILYPIPFHCWAQNGLCNFIHIQRSYVLIWDQNSFPTWRGTSLFLSAYHFGVCYWLFDGTETQRSLSDLRCLQVPVRVVAFSDCAIPPYSSEKTGIFYKLELATVLSK